MALHGVDVAALDRSGQSLFGAVPDSRLYIMNDKRPHKLPARLLRDTALFEQIQSHRKKSRHKITNEGSTTMIPHFRLWRDFQNPVAHV